MSSTDIAVSARNLAKAYKIAHNKETHNTLAESLLSQLKNPFRRVSTEIFWALKDINFEIKRGEVVGIVGRNGAGKSTLLKVLSRITEPTLGEIDIRGRVGSLLEVGTGFHPELTGRENIYLNGAILGMSRAEIRRQFDAIVDFAGTEKFLDTPVKRYSSGMYVRLAFAVAAHLNSDILIVDEVLAVGDANFQRKCLGKLKDVSGHGRTVLFVSHNIGMLKSLCQTAIRLKGGLVVDHGPAKQVIDRYSGDEVDLSRHRMDVSRVPRLPGMGERLRVLEISVNDGQPVYYGDPLKIKLTYEAFTPIDQLAFGFGIGTVEGSRLMTLDSDQPGPRFDVRKGVDTTHLIADQAWLEPGVYSILVGVRSGEISSLDYVGNCGYIEVLASARSTAAAQSGMDGGVRPPSEWTVPRNSIDINGIAPDAMNIAVIPGYRA